MYHFIRRAVDFIRRADDFMSYGNNYFHFKIIIKELKYLQSLYYIITSFLWLLV